MPDSPKPDARPSKAARQATIANYLIKGYSLTRIAETLGYSTRHISRDIREMEARFRQQAEQEVRLAKGIDLERLDTLLSFVWPQCEQGHVPAIRAATEIIMRRARLLGADAPHQIAQTVDDRRQPDLPSHLAGLTDDEALTIYRQVLHEGHGVIG